MSRDPKYTQLYGSSFPELYKENSPEYFFTQLKGPSLGLTSNRPDYTIKDTPGPGAYQGRLDGDERLLRKQISENQQAYRSLVRKRAQKSGSIAQQAPTENTFRATSQENQELSNMEAMRLGPAPVLSPSIQADKKFSFYKFKNDIMFLEEPEPAGDAVGC